MNGEEHDSNTTRFRYTDDGEDSEENQENLSCPSYIQRWKQNTQVLTGLHSDGDGDGDGDGVVMVTVTAMAMVVPVHTSIAETVPVAT